MQGLNVLGLNLHDSKSHGSSDSIEQIMKGASANMNSFKEVENSIKNLEDKIDSINVGDGSTLKDYLKKNDANNLYQEKGNYLTEHQSLEGYAKTIDIPDVSSFITENDLPDYSEVFQPKGEYLTQHQDISHLATKSEIDTLVNTAVSAEMTKLTEGASADFDTFKEISDWITQHGSTASNMIGAINDHAKNIGALETKVKNLEDANYITKDSFDTVVLTAETESGETITFTLAGISNS